MEIAAGTYKDIIFPTVRSRAEVRMSDSLRAMLDATPDCIKILSVNGTLLNMNRAGCVALGVPNDSELGMPWLPLLPESVRAAGSVALLKAADGHSARFAGQSVTAEGMMFWDNLLTPIIDDAGNVTSILCVSRDVTAKTRLEADLAEAMKRERLMSREMRHRIKNLFSIVGALISISEKEARMDNAPETATSILRERMCALHRASDAVFSPELGDAGPNDTTLDVLVNSVLQPYAGRCRASGPATALSANNVTTIALILHELATNSVKYGALSNDSGSIVVSWGVDDNLLKLIWTESGGPSIGSGSVRQGFGTQMVERMVQSAGGRIEKSWQPGGLMAELQLPHPI